MIEAVLNCSAEPIGLDMYVQRHVNGLYSQLLSLKGTFNAEH